MDGRAKRGESLAGKTIALAAVLVTLLAAGTLLSACAQPVSYTHLTLPTTPYV